jgi:hypothetical protein
MNVFRDKPRRIPKQIVDYQNLPVALRTGADPDGGNLNCLGNLTAGLREHQLQNDRKRAGFRDGPGLLQQEFSLRLRLPFDLVSTLFVDVLRQHPEVGHHWDTRVRNSSNLFGTRRAAF